MRREDEATEGPDANAEEEHLGDLPNVREMKARRARLNRKVQAHQMKELQEERLKMGQTVEGFMEQFQENQQQMLDLERQVEQLKEREQQKALEIRRWQTSSDALQKDSLRLKRQLAVVTERLTQAEKSAAEAQQGVLQSVLEPTTLGQNEDSEEAVRQASGRAAVEQLQMRLADYESLVVEFADQASKAVEDTEGLEPLDLSSRFEDTDAADKSCLHVSEPVAAHDPLASSAVAGLEIERFKIRCENAEKEIEVLSLRCKDAEQKTHAAISQYEQAQGKIDVVQARWAEAEAAAEDSASRCALALSNLQLAQARNAGAEAEASAMAERVERAQGELQVALLAQQRAGPNDVVDGVATMSDSVADSVAAAAGRRVEELVAKCAELELQAEATEARRSGVEGELQVVKNAIEDSLRQQGQAQEHVTSLQAQCALNRRRHLESIRHVQTVLSLFHGVHKGFRQQLDRSQVSKREARRLQSELVLAHALCPVAVKNTAGKPPHGDAAVDCPADATAFLAPATTSDAVEQELEKARQAAQDAEVQVLALQGQLDSALSAARDEVANLRNQLHTEELAHAELQRRAELYEQEAGAQDEERIRFRQVAAELQNSRAESEAARVQVALLQKEAAAARAALVGYEVGGAKGAADVASTIRPGQGALSEEGLQLIARERSALELRMRNLQEHLDEETEHFDVLAAAHEEVLELSSRLQIERADLANQLEASYQVRGALEQELQRVSDSAQKSVAIVRKKAEDEAKQMSQSFQSQVQKCSDQAQEALEALRLEKAARAALQVEQQALAARLEQERVQAGQQAISAGQELARRREEHAELEMRAAVDEEQLGRAREELELAEASCGNLARDLEAARLALEHSEAGCQALEGQAGEREALVERLKEQLALATEGSEQLEAAREQMREQLSEALQRVEQEESGRSTLEEQLHSATLAEADAAARNTASQLAEVSAAAAAAEREAARIQLADIQAELEAAVAGRSFLEEQLQDLANAKNMASAASAEREAAHARLLEVRTELGAAVDARLELQEQLGDLVEAKGMAAAAAADRDAVRTQLEETRMELDAALAASSTLEEQLREFANTQSLAAATGIEKEAAYVQLVDVQRELDAAVAARSALEEQLKDSANTWHVNQSELLEASQNLQKAEAARDAAIQQVQGASDHAMELAKERDDAREALRQSREEMDQLLRRHEGASSSNEDMQHQVVRSLSDVAQMRSECQTLREQVQDLERMRQDAVRRCEEAEQQLVVLTGERATVQRERETLAQQLAEALELCGRAETARDALQDQLTLVSGSATRLQEELRDVQQQLEAVRCKSTEVHLGEAEDPHILMCLQAEISRLKDAELRLLAGLERERALGREALAEQAAKGAFDREQALVQQAQQHTLEREQALSVVRDQLRQQMQVEAQKYMMAVQEQARTAIAQRDQQILQLSQNLSERDARLQQVLQECAVTDAQLARMVEENCSLQAQRADRGSMADAADTAWLDSLYSEQDLLQHQLASARQELQTVRNHGEAPQKELDTLDPCVQDAQVLLKQRDDELERLRAQLSQAREPLHHEAEDHRREFEEAQHRANEATEELARLRQQLATERAERQQISTQLGFEAAEMDGQEDRHLAIEREREYLETQLEDARVEVRALSFQRDSSQQQLGVKMQELRAMSAQTDALRQHFDGLALELDERQRQVVEQDAQVDSLRQNLAEVTAERHALARQLEDRQSSGVPGDQQEHVYQEQDLRLQCVALEGALAGAQQKLAESMAEQRSLVAECERLRTESAMLAPGVVEPLPAQEATEATFRTQIEELQSELTAKTLVVEALQHQLSTERADTLRREGAGHADIAIDGEQRLLAQCKQLQLRLAAVEEEKTVMLAEMRKHLLQLARDNYDLKQRPQALSPRSAPVHECDVASTSAALVPAQSQMGDARASDTVVDAGSGGTTPDVRVEAAGGSASGGGWLSYVFSPFLTESDMREIHAEAYVGEALKGQPLVLT